MIPPTSIDGTDITGATIDGTDVQEITVDGDVVFSAGPQINNFPVAYSNLIAWYPFDSATYTGSNADDVTAILGGSGDGTAYDGSVSGASYQSSGGVTDIDAGANSGAFDYSGSERITANGSGLKLTTQTAMAWIRQDSPTGAVPFSHADAGGVQDGWSIDLREEIFEVEFTLKIGNAAEDIIAGSYQIGDWFHVALTTTGVNGTFSAFLNGSFGGSANYINYVVTPDPLTMGRALDTFFDPFDGRVDDVRIYNTVLSQSQIDQIYQNTKP